MERVSDSDLATNCGTYERQASKPTKVTMKERACNSPTRFGRSEGQQKKVSSVTEREEKPVTKARNATS